MKLLPLLMIIYSQTNLIIYDQDETELYKGKAEDIQLEFIQEYADLMAYEISVEEDVMFIYCRSI